MKTLRLILGDQLNPNHSWFKNVDDEIVYVLMEVKQETNWGTPISVSRITNSYGVTEIQYYAGGHSLMYSNGILNSIYQR